MMPEFSTFFCQNPERRPKKYRVAGAWWDENRPFICGDSACPRVMVDPYNYGIRFSAARARTRRGWRAAVGRKSRRPSDRHACQGHPRRAVARRAARRAGCQTAALPRPGARLHPEWQAHHTRDPHRSVGAGAIYCASGTLAPDRGRPRSSRRVEPRSDLPYRLIRIRRSRREGRAGHGADGAAGSAVAPQIHAGHRRGAFRGAQRVPGANPRSPGAQRDWGRGGGRR